MHASLPPLIWTKFPLPLPCLMICLSLYYFSSALLFVFYKNSFFSYFNSSCCCCSFSRYSGARALQPCSLPSLPKTLPISLPPSLPP